MNRALNVMVVDSYLRMFTRVWLVGEGGWVSRAGGDDGRGEEEDLAVEAKVSQFFILVFDILFARSPLGME